MTNNDDNWFNSLINKYKRKEHTQQLTEQQIRELKEKIAYSSNMAQVANLDKTSSEYKILEFCHNHDIMGILREEFERNPVDYEQAQKEREQSIINTFNNSRR